MMNEKQVPIEDLRAAVQEILYTVSGAYCSEFWDGMREVCDSLDTVRAIKKAIELLHVSGHDTVLLLRNLHVGPNGLLMNQCITPRHFAAWDMAFLMQKERQKMMNIA